jgi:curved DNA-binding protein
LQYKDYYQVLGVAKDACAQEIQKAYRGLARKFHPDVNKDPGAENRFKEIGEAYEVLHDAEKRQKYDQYGAAWKQAQATGSPFQGAQGYPFDFAQGAEGFDLGSSGFSSFFEMLFGDEVKFTHRPGGGSTRRVRVPRAGRDLESTLRVSLEELATGGKRRIDVVDPTTGSRRSIEVTLPKGVLPKQKIRLAGRGEQGSDGHHGDLLLQIELEPHPQLELDGRDLKCKVKVAPWQAALGGTVSVPTLERPVQIRVPEGSSTGRRIRLRGKGLPNPAGPAGDLLVELEIAMPEELAPEERELYERLRDLARPAPVRSGG